MRTLNTQEINEVSGGTVGLAYVGPAGLNPGNLVGYNYQFIGRTDNKIYFNLNGTFQWIPYPDCAPFGIVGVGAPSGGGAPAPAPRRRGRW